MADAVYSKAGKKSDGGREKVLVASFDSLAFTLDSLLNVPDLGSRYGSAALRMRTLAEDLQKTNNLYNPVFLKVADLYDKIAGFCEKSKKVDDLTKENINLSTQLESKKLEYDKLKLDKDKLEIQLEKAK
jgi:hypothetical protein